MDPKWRNPFPQRPWMESSGAAAAATGASGLKGRLLSFVFSENAT